MTHEADILDNDKNGKPAQGYYDAAGDTVNSAEGDPTVNSQHVTNHVWNPSTLAWEKRRPTRRRHLVPVQIYLYKLESHAKTGPCC